MPEATQRPTLNLTRRFNAAPERIWRAWTEPSQVGAWFGPRGMQCTVDAWDARVGGRYSVTFPAPPEAPPGMDTLNVFGEFLEADPPRRLVYTWAWDSPGWAGKSSTVTVEIEADGAGSLVRITHADLLDADALQNHGEGWAQSLDRLEEFVSQN